MALKLVLSAVTALASVAQAFGSFQAAGAQAEAAAAQVSNARRQAEVDAATQSAERARRFEAATSSQVAHAAARGIDLNSFDAIARGDREALERDQAVIKSNLGGRLYNLQLYGWDAEQSARSKQTNAIFGAGKSLFDFGRSVYREWGSGGSGSGEGPSSVGLG